MLYRHLADYFHREGDAVAIFNNSWSWNLMCRSFNVSLLHAPSLAWAGDCISVEFGQDKTKKNGGKGNKQNSNDEAPFCKSFRTSGIMPHIYATFMPRIYATFMPHVCVTFMPHIYSTHLRHIYATHLRHIYVTQVCPFVSLGLLIGQAPLTGLRKGGKLLPKDSFRKTLHTLFKGSKIDPEDDVLLMQLSPVEQRLIAFRKQLDEAGIPYCDIGAHSYRKGSATYTAPPYHSHLFESRMEARRSPEHVSLA